MESYLSFLSALERQKLLARSKFFHFGDRLHFEKVLSYGKINRTSDICTSFQNGGKNGGIPI